MSEVTTNNPPPLIERLEIVAWNLQQRGLPNAEATVREAISALRSPAPGAEAMREAAIEAHRHLQTWLDADACDCEFETGHVCGRVQIAATVKRLEAAIRAIPAREVPEECHDSSDAVTGGGDK